MNRRDTIKRLMAASGAVVALPAWANGWSNTSHEVMVDYLHFKQVPGHYCGCVDVNA